MHGRVLEAKSTEAAHCRREPHCGPIVDKGASNPQQRWPILPTAQSHQKEELAVACVDVWSIPVFRTSCSQSKPQAVLADGPIPKNKTKSVKESFYPMKVFMQRPHELPSTVLLNTDGNSRAPSQAQQEAVSGAHPLCEQHRRPSISYSRCHYFHYYFHY